MTQQIINTWDQCTAAGGDCVAIYYHPYNARACSPAKWSVSRFKDGKELVTDKEAAWYDYKRKTFSIGHPIREHKQAALAEAINWVCKTYGPRTFVRNRMGDYVEQDVNERFPIPRREP